MHQKNGFNWIWLSTRLAIYARDDFDCVWCRSLFPLTNDGYGLSLDHVYGPSNAPDNLVTCCTFCNTSRHNTSIEEWLRGDRTKQRRLKRALSKPIDRKLGRLLLDAREKGIPFDLILKKQLAIKGV